MLAALDALERPAAAVLRLIYLRGATRAQVAACSGRSVTDVDSVVADGLRQLAAHMFTIDTA